MERFSSLSAVAVPLDIANLDTDQIIPARFLRRSRSDGYGNFLFHDLRREAGDFELDQPRYAGAGILVADANFGCGSSREGAVYALLDAGIRCVIAPSFGDIFAANAAKNGLLAVGLPADAVERLRTQLRARPGARITVDLPAQRVVGSDRREYAFEIDPFRKQCLVEGLDEIELTFQYANAIAAFERADAAARPWAAAKGKEVSEQRRA